MQNKIEMLETDEEYIDNAEYAENIVSVPVPPNEIKTRLDKWLSLCFQDLSRARITNLINKGYVSCNGTIITSPSYHVKEAEIFSLQIPPAEPDIPIPEDIPLDVMYEDNDIIVVNKKPGMVVHPAAGNKQGTLVNALLFYAKGRLSGIGGIQRAGIVHRIDKDTSGILVIAKNDVAHRELSKKFSIHDIERVYKAIVYGVPEPLSGVIKNNIGRCPTNRQKMAVVKQGGKEAVTNYKTLQILANGAASLIECRLETGRTHQIRVHMTYIGHPLIGDDLYKFNRKFAKVPVSEAQRRAITSFSRQALHAEVLGFNHPISGEKMFFKTEMPEDMQQLYQQLITT